MIIYCILYCLAKLTSPRVRRRTVSATVAPTPVRCVNNATKWGACSVSCGTGLSQRYSNQNEDCEMRKELRVCQIRPCGNVYPPVRRND